MTTAPDRYFRLLGFMLLGYALVGKSFAYLGAAPVFIGEMVLAVGLLSLMASADWDRILRTWHIWPLAAFMLWGARSTLPYLGKYGPDTLRDAAVWGWGLFAIVTGSLLAAEPSRLLRLEKQYRTFARLFLIGAPISWLLTRYGEHFLPMAPWANVPLVYVKGGDQIVHLTAVFAYAVLLSGGLAPWLVAVCTAATLVVNITGRAALVTFAIGAAVVTVLKPRSKIVLSLAGSCVVAVLLLWILNINVEIPGENPRYVSADQLFQNVASIFGDSDNENLAGSKEWRLKWWNEIYSYTFHGKYFWSGKGFGVNLADDDGFQCNADDSLRSPHNGHLTMLARMGVPGLALWALVQLSWAASIFWNFVRARWRHETRWAGLFMFLFVYWAAFMVNAAFDVYLEGPLGGIWMWSVYGVGLGALWIFEHCPEAIDEQESSAVAETADDRLPEASLAFHRA